MKRAFVLLSLVAALTVGAAAALAGNPRDEKLRLRPADTALARRAVLRRADLPAGWSVAPLTGADDESIRCAGYDPDLSRFTVTGKARSAFVKPAGGASVASAVQVFATAAEAAADFDVVTKPALMTCVRAQLVRQLRSTGVATARIASQHMSASPRVGARSATYRFVLEIAAGPARLRYHVALVTFRAGRAIGVLSFGALGGSMPTEAALARRVAARLR